VPAVSHQNIISVFILGKSGIRSLDKCNHPSCFLLIEKDAPAIIMNINPLKEILATVEIQICPRTL